jgi:hypothetical protein
MSAVVNGEAWCLRESWITAGRERNLRRLRNCDGVGCLGNARLIVTQRQKAIFV